MLKRLWSILLLTLAFAVYQEGEVQAWDECFYNGVICCDYTAWYAQYNSSGVCESSHSEDYCNEACGVCEFGGATGPALGCSGDSLECTCAS